jgi:hypothetical protein
MPLVLIAGTVAGQPKADPFPSKGRPHAECRLEVTDDGCVTLYRIVGFDESMEMIERLAPGDAVSVQGSLRLEHKDNKITSLFIVAGRVLPLRQRSPNLRFGI